MVDTTFVIAAAGAIALALAFILWPLLRKSEQSPSPVLVLALVLLIPVGTFTLYRFVGAPEGLNTAETPAQNLNQAIGQLTRRLERDPDDIEGWLLLGLSYKQLEQFTSAEQALHRAVMLDESNAHAKVELAETILFARGQQRMPAESRLLLEQAVELDPRHQKGLWLLGIGAFQDGDFQGALSWWERLDAQLEDGSVRDSVRAQMTEAQARLDGSESTPVTPAGTEAAPEAAVTVTVSLSPELSDGLSGDETVFIYARAPDGPPMPVAIQRLRADDLPATVRLSDRDAMTPEMRLSQFPQVTLTARVSFSGDAIAQPGDLQGVSEPLPTADGHRVTLEIDERVE